MSLHNPTLLTREIGNTQLSIYYYFPGIVTEEQHIVLRRNAPVLSILGNNCIPHEITGEMTGLKGVSPPHTYGKLIGYRCLMGCHVFQVKLNAADWGPNGRALN